MDFMGTVFFLEFGVGDYPNDERIDDLSTN